MIKRLVTIIYFDLLLTFRDAFSWITPLIFFVIVVSLFPMALGSNDSLLTQVAPGVIWVTALLTVLMSIDHIFEADAREGFLDTLILSNMPLTLIVLCKVISHWLAHCLPLVLISPLLGIFLHLSAYDCLALFISLLLGTPILSLLGAIGAALTVGLTNSGLLLPILIMPLYIPVLIFGSGAMLAANLSEPLTVYLLILSALGLITLAFAPIMTSAALRIGVNQ
jgi:heme exporter protein B